MPDNYNQLADKWENNTETMVQFHLKSMQFQLGQVYYAFALALATNRTLIMPKVSAAAAVACWLLWAVACGEPACLAARRLTHQPQPQPPDLRAPTPHHTTPTTPAPHHSHPPRSCAATA